MRCLALLSVLAACNAFAGGTPEPPQERDGVWLQNGIKQQQRQGAHENLSEKEARDALVVSSYICGVVEL